MASLSELFRPPKRISVSDAAEKHFHLPEGGKFEIATAPYMKTAMDLLTDRSVTTIVFVAPARTGKTLALITGSLVYIITSNPSDALVVHMTEAAARKYSKLTIARMIHNSPALSKLLSPSKDDNNILAKFFRNGMALMIGHPSPTQLSAADYKFVMLSDYDRMPEDNGEGNIYIQASKRTQTFMSAGCTVVESSPGRDFVDTEWVKEGEHEAPPVGGILGLYNDGDRRIQYWNCPHCSEDFPLFPGLELFMLPPQDELLADINEMGAQDAAIKWAKMWCPKCFCQIDESEKQHLNLTGKWITETDKPNSTASFWLSGYAAAFQTWSSILEKEFKGLEDFSKTGDESKIKATRNVDQSIPYMPISILTKLSAKALELRAEDLPKREVPEGVRFLVGTIDIQKYGFVCQVEGFGVDYESWIIDRFVLDVSKRPMKEGSEQMSLMSPSAYLEDWDCLEKELIMKRYPLANDPKGRTMGMLITGSDSHGQKGVTENAYKFWKKMKKKLKRKGIKDRFHLLRGLRPSPKATTPLVHKVVLDKSSKSARNAKIIGEDALWNVNTTQYKDTVLAHLTRDTFGAMYVHTPDHLPSGWYAEVVAETRSESGWDNLAGRPNEAGDCLVYARALLEIKRILHWQNEINWDAPPAWADVWDRNSEVSVPDDIDDRSTNKVKKSSVRNVRMTTSRSTNRR